MFPSVSRLFCCLLPSSLLLCSSLPAAQFTVSTTNDSGAGSLRQAIADAAASAGSDNITFAAALDGATITLTTSLVVGTDDVTIDASGLLRGITLSGGGTTRILQANAGSTLFIQRVNFTRGNAGTGDGGAIATGGNTFLIDCTFTENNADVGGAIFGNGAGALTVVRSTFAFNTANDSAALWIEGTRTANFSNTTITQNRCNTGGTGAITALSDTSLTLFHCTLVGNAGDLYGGGVYSSGTLIVNRSIIAQNTALATVSPDIYDDGATLTVQGASLLGSNGAALDGNVSADYPTAPPLVGTTGALIDPKLGPLVLGGRLTAAHWPRFDSPAIDAGTGSTATEDQRGFPRGVNGDSDLGAIERGPIIKVDNLADSGTGSLRDAIAQATEPDTRIFFDEDLPGGTITLTTGELVVNDERSLEIDASPSAAAGVFTISGGGQFRVFNVSGFASLSLNRLVVSGGFRTGGVDGGGVLVADSTLLAYDTTFSGNTTNGSGGAIALTAPTALSTGVLHRCTLSGNSAGTGGAARQSGIGGLTLSNCTISGNVATGASGVGGVQGAALILQHCTVTANTGTGAGGGVNFSSSLRLERSLLAGNLSSGNSVDLFKAGGAITVFGSNLLGSNGSGQTGSVATEFPAGALVGTPGSMLNAQLGALASYGGPTQTIALRASSPARGAATTSPLATDQRGFARPAGAADLGAYEAGTISTFAAWAEETIGQTLSTTGDNDGDGAANLLEYALRRTPLSADAPLGPTLTSGAGATKIFAFRYTNLARDLRYIIQRSSDLGGTWTEVCRLDTSTGALTGSPLPVVDSTNQTITLTDPAGGARNFWRLLVQRVP